MAEGSLKLISKRFANAIGVDDLNVEIHDREFVDFLAPSEWGKTTILRSIDGLEHLQEGNILIEARWVNHLQPIVISSLCFGSIRRIRIDGV